MQYSEKHKGCMYETLDGVPLSLLTGAKDLGKNGFFVPCTIENMQVMAALGKEAYSPILIDYDWPMPPGRKPWPHQQHMAAFMVLHPRAFNLSDMGTGKTMAVLWAWDYLMKVGQVHQVIIACTMSCMTDVWQREIMTNFLGRRKAVVVHGDRKKRVERLREHADFYIINHDGFAIGSKNIPKFTAGPLALYLAANPNIDGVTIDEGAEFRHQSTDAYKSLRTALRNKPYFNWLTGTPVPKDPTDAYAQAKMVRLDFNESFTSFRERTMYKIDNFRWKAKTEGYDMAAEILKPAIRYGIKDCMQLPPVVKLDRTAELSPGQVAAIKQLKAELNTLVAGGKVTALNEASLRTKLLQIAAGAVYGEDKAVLKLDCAPRMKVLREAIEQSTHKIIIFASLTSVVDMLHSELSKEYTVEKITGKVGNGRRNEIFNSFREAENPRIIVADPGCMAHGLTLTPASTTIWYTPHDNGGVYQQANKRMDRPGQKNNMLLVRISSTATEREIYRRLDTGESLQGAMLNLIRGEE